MGDIVFKKAAFNCNCYKRRLATYRTSKPTVEACQTQCWGDMRCVSFAHWTGGKPGMCVLYEAACPFAVNGLDSGTRCAVPTSPAWPNVAYNKQDMIDPDAKEAHWLTLSAAQVNSAAQSSTQS